jgi:predicted RND superfamily exporter protein
MRPLRTLARLQLERPMLVAVLAVVLTVVLGAGIPQIELQTDFQDSLPKSLEPVKAQDKVEAAFGSPDAIIVLFAVNDAPQEESFVTDIRDPQVVESMLFLQDELSREPIVADTSSMASLFDAPPASTAEVKQTLASSNADVTNRDYTATTMFVRLSEEMTEENIRRATDTIEENIAQTPTYPGVDVRITGTPVIRTDISDILVSDTATTIGIASFFILVLLVGVRGVVRGPITFIPLFMGLVWTLGVMGWAGIPLSFATISLGSMILGLGVEYGSFITERILEEMAENGLEDAIYTAVPNTGKAILGSATTDGVGFLALLLASIIFIRDLGITLALGEFLTVSAALVITPTFMVLYRRWRQ